MRGGCPLLGPLTLSLGRSTLSSVTGVTNDLLSRAFQMKRVKTNVDHSYICTSFFFFFNHSSWQRQIEPTTSWMLASFVTAEL